MLTTFPRIFVYMIYAFHGKQNVRISGHKHRFFSFSIVCFEAGTVAVSYYFVFGGIFFAFNFKSFVFLLLFFLTSFVLPSRHSALNAIIIIIFESPITRKRSFLCLWYSEEFGVRRFQIELPAYGTSKMLPYQFQPLDHI